MTTNPYSKVKNFHLTYKGHYILTIPYEYEWLGYCHEESDTDHPFEHTHVILKTVTKISKMELLGDLEELLEIPCNLDVKVHERVETILGYHIGLGDKPRCTTLTMIKPDFDIDRYISSKIMHKPRGIIQNAERNRIILETDNNKLVDLGYIPIEKLQLISKNKAEYEFNQPDTRERLPDVIPNTWGLYMPNDRTNKKCHYWIWSRSRDRGKSTFGRSLCRKYRGYSKSSKWNWWNIRKDCDFVVMDAYTGGITWSDFESMLEGDAEYEMKYRTLFTTNAKPIFIVLSNLPIHEIYIDPIGLDKLLGRFSIINVEDNPQYE